VASTSSAAAEPRPQADALPSKRGEIGYEEPVQQPQEEMDVTEVIEGGETLPTRHPADSASPVLGETTLSAALPHHTSRDSRLSTDTAATRKLGKRPFFSLFSMTIGGVLPLSVLRFLIQLSFIGGTLAAWIIITRHLGQTTVSITNTSSDQQGSALMGGSAAIFIHVAFGVATLAQLIFLERCIFHLRAQRYCYLHPGAVLPSHGRSLSSGSPAMGFAPWNRQPLPTYAAALAQSGHGTGDVEDNAIAIPPPPAYGNTRGSTLLLAGFLRNSLRHSVPTEAAERNRASQTVNPEGRPMSYISRDEEWEERCDAERAIMLEETLARLEEGPGSTSQPQSTSTR